MDIYPGLKFKLSIIIYIFFSTTALAGWDATLIALGKKRFQKRFYIRVLLITDHRTIVKESFNVFTLYEIVKF